MIEAVEAEGQVLSVPTKRPLLETLTRCCCNLTKCRHDLLVIPAWTIYSVVCECPGNVSSQPFGGWCLHFHVLLTMLLRLQAEFYVIYTSVFVWLFISYEFVKPDQPWHFEPDVYYDPELLNGAREPEKLVDRPSKE